MSSCDDSWCFSPTDKENVTRLSTSSQARGVGEEEGMEEDASAGKEKVIVASSTTLLPQQPPAPPQPLPLAHSPQLVQPLPVLLTQLEEVQQHLTEYEMDFIEEFGVSAFSNI